MSARQRRSAGKKEEKALDTAAPEQDQGVDLDLVKLTIGVTVVLFLVIVWYLYEVFG